MLVNLKETSKIMKINCENNIRAHVVCHLIQMGDLKGILGLLVISVIIISTQNGLAITQSQIFQGNEGSIVELTATIETTNLNEGEHVLGIEITLISLGPNVTGIDFIIVYYRIGDYSNAIDFSNHLLSEGTEELKQTTTFIYDKEWDDVMLEISLLFFENCEEEEVVFPDNMHYSDYQPYFKVTPKRFLIEHQYIFSIAIFFVIVLFHISVMKLKKQSFKSSDILFSCAKCGFESNLKTKDNPHKKIQYSCPNCNFGKYDVQFVE